MARGTQLIKLLEMLRGELGRATSVAVGVDDAEGLKIKLRARQELLYDDYDWPFLRERFRKDLLWTERYYDLPTGLNLERIEEAHVWYGNLPRPIERTIEEQDYAYFRSDDGIVADPVLKWDVRFTGTAPQIEVWPVPASNNQYIIWRGIRNLNPLIADEDTADLDDQLIVLLTAAEIMEKQGSPSAGTLKKLANGRLVSMRARARGAQQRYRLGMGVVNPDRPNKIVVRAS
ncbi:MAG TPA: hypothetical protein VNO55_08745 [Polyangia bacterium]|nr:hypothetical protein [Polyangia bacterium]